MDDSDFDKALVGAALAIAARDGWAGLSAAAAATEAGLDVARARARFPARIAVLMRLGLLADQAALTDRVTGGQVRDRLFDMIMRRIDVFQAHREGVLAVLRYLPSDPPLALGLALATRRSMRWLLEAAGVPTRSVRGELTVRGLVGVWLWTLNAWRSDASPDMAATMAALERALDRAEQAANWLPGGPTAAAVEDAVLEPELPPALPDMPPDPPASPAPFV